MDVGTGAMASLLPKLVELLNKKYKLPASIREDVELLSQEMERMHAVLLKVVELPQGYLEETVKDWVKEVRLRQLSYNMDVVVDKLLVLAPNPEGFRGVRVNIGHLLKKGRTRHQIITSAIKDIKARVQNLANRYERYKIADVIFANPAATTIVDPRVFRSYKVEGLVGIDGKKDRELIKLLSDEDNASNKELKVVSVVGFGGVGKTTLVRAVYVEIGGGFDCKAFVGASLAPDLRRILRDIISQLTMNYSYTDTCKLDEQQLINKLREILENKRYLIVIDDIYDENVWQCIKCAFSNENNCGSRVITTTRKVNVSKACCSTANDSIYQMEPMSHDESKKLLYTRMFGSASGCPHELTQVSSDILKKCGGVPLAIITMASILANDWHMKTNDQWHALLNSIGRGVASASWKMVEGILSCSYYDLPPHLKTCSLYMSTFPVTQPIEKDRLVKKLIAEGIVSQQNKLIGSSNRKEAKLSQEVSLEEAASQYLDELVNSNVIHPLVCNNDGEVITYHIHPVMHDALKAIAIEEKFAASVDGKDISSARSTNFPHLSIDCSDSENLTDLSSMAFGGGVRSLTILGHANRFLLRQFKGIRILDLEDCKSMERADVECICSMVLLQQLCLAKTDITELPPEIGNLHYLEGLDIGETQITQLPPQIGKLQHLKTLDARKSLVKDLPAQVVRLTRLVHLLIGDNESCEGVKLPNGIGKMKSLQQLCTIDLRKCSASSLKELGELLYLKDIAVVSSDEPKDTRMNNALLSSLDKSTELRSLVVYSDFRLSTLQSSSKCKYLICRKKLTVLRRSLKVPICIAGQSFLGMLDIRVCKLEEDDLKILRELPILESLIVRLEVLPTKMIHISCEGFAKVESFNVDCRMPRVVFEEGTMPKLEHLELKLYAGSASEDHMGIKHLLNLQKITLRYSKWYATNKGVREMTDAMSTEAKEHQNEITLCIAEENKDGTCTMKTEIFQENKDASCSRITEIEEEEDRHADGTGYFLDGDDTQGADLHQSNHDIASCSGTSEIEEVVE